MMHANLNGSMKFRHLTVEQGLSESKVSCILKDSRGIMWFGTGYNGLNRYDGYTFTSYKSDPNDPHSIPYNIIHKLFEDREGNLWVGTRNGLSRYDRALDRFDVFLKDATGNADISSDDVHAIYQDAKGVLWVGTAKGLAWFDSSRSKFVFYRHDPRNQSTISHDFICDMTEDDRGRLWICTQGGLNLFDKGTRTFRRFTAVPGNPRSLSHNHCSAITSDEAGSLWIMTAGGGLNRLDPETGLFRRYIHSASNPNSLSLDRGYCLAVDGKGTVFVGTENGGLNVFDVKNERFSCHLPDLDDETSINSNSISALYYDSAGILWIGTENGGVNLSSPYLDRFDHIANTKTGLNHSVVLGFAEDRSGALWIGTDGGGLNRWDRAGKRFDYFRHDPGDASTIGSNAVLSVYVDSRNRVWAGTYLGGLNLLDPATGRFRRFVHDPKNRKSLINNSVRRIMEDRKGRLWVATDSGLVRLEDPVKKTFAPVSDWVPADVALNNLNALVEDGMGRLWVGGYGTGLYCLDPEKRTAVHFRHDPNQSGALAGSDVLSLLIDHNGHLWVGTQSGLNRYHPEDGHFAAMTVKDGLPDNKIAGLLEDGAGNLWIATSRGLSKVIHATRVPEANPAGRTVIRNYDTRDGIQGAEFRTGSGFKNAGGEMFFGGNNGFNIFNPDQTPDNPLVPPVLFTGFKLFNQDAPVGESGSPLQRAIGATDLIGLSHRQSVFTIEFAGLNYILPEKNRYATMMQGFDKTWNEIGGQRSATYTNLNAGSYTFRVKASNNDGLWNGEGASIRIVITPPFWKTWWFKSAAALLAAAAAWLVQYFRIRQIRRRKEELEVLVRQRTRELNEKNALLERANSELDASNSALNQSNLELEQARVMLTQANGDLQTSNRELELFASVASHDLQEPLRMVSSYLGLITKRFGGRIDNEGREFIDFAVDGARRMQQLIEDLLSYSRVTTQGKPFESTNTEKSLRQALKNLEVAIVESGAVVTHDALPTVEADPVQFERLLQNLVGNALKYRADKAPRVRIQVREKAGFFVFSVQDNGIGIDPRHHERVFGIFQRLHTREKYAGTGIGLAVCRKIVERHGGTIWVESQENRGATFFFTLPSQGAESKQEQSA